jgi:sugar fermentation stimulation protein A
MDMRKHESKLRIFPKTLKAHFLSRPNRFLMRCRWKGRKIFAFLPNPGRLQELLIPGSLIYVAREEKPRQRKTRFTAVAVEKDGCPIMLHTLRNNEVAKYLLQAGTIPGLEDIVVARSEVRMGQSRFYFIIRRGEKSILLEVKSCTLVSGSVAMFPDAVTERGARHLRELARLSEEGVETAVLFIVHWPLARVFMPDYHTDLNFSQTLLSIRDKVKVIPVSVNWKQDLSVAPRVRLLQIPWSYIKEEAKDKGSYLLILELKRARKIPVGRLGKVFFRKGFYIYVGSAMAHLTKRMERHRRLRKEHHWHIDALRAVADFHSILPIRSSARLECEIAEALSKISEWATPEFGCTDCSCNTHLFAFKKNPLHLKKFHQLLQYFRMDRYQHSMY